MRLITSLSVVLATALGASAARAQVFHMTPPEKAPSRVFLGIGVEYGQPLGEFDDFIGNSWGVGGSFLYALDSRGIVGLRVDANYLNYGREHKRVPLSATIGGRILVDVTTSNNIFLAGIGPQFMVPSGPVRPYLTGAIGLAYFYTQSSVEGSADNDDFGTTTIFHDATFAWSGAGGFYIGGGHGRHSIAIDLGARYQSNGNVRYLREGSIVDNPNSTISITPTESQANMIIYHLGVVFGL
jgi:hypothetical protein